MTKIIKMMDLLKKQGMELGKVYTDKDMPPFKVNEDKHKEGKMAKYDVKEICQDSQDVFKMIDETDNLPEWLEAKITIAAHNMNAVKDYLTHHKSDKDDEKISEMKVNSSKVRKTYESVLNHMRKVIKKLNDDEMYAVTTQLKKWFNKNIM